MKQSIVFSVFLSLLLLFVTLRETFQIKPEDQKQVTAFQAKIQKQKEDVSFTKDALQKDIFFLEASQRLHCKITGDHSKFSIEGRKAVEKLQGVKCWLQDQLIQNENETKQQVKYFEAKEGTYFLPSHQFFSQKVDLAFFSLDGSDIPQLLSLEKAYLTGYAKKVALQLHQSSKTFEATHLHALFKTNEIQEEHVKSKKSL